MSLLFFLCPAIEQVVYRSQLALRNHDTIGLSQQLAEVFLWKFKWVINAFCLTPFLGVREECFPFRLDGIEGSTQLFPT